MSRSADKQFASTSTLMIQGCTSDAGKSLMVAGLARVLSRKGIRLAPFKPQNMALNSAVTVDGGEIGRAQALQAAACGVEAETDFNPVLLKPCTDVGAQVIVHGKALSTMQAKEFHDYKKVAMQAVMESHQRLISKYGNVLVEGAGSPAEINLREGDIANMGFAEAADCPVILVADIDKGGVFAHLVGTLELLSETEQNRIIGFIINKFRGDIALLEPGIDWLEQRTGKPVIGVVPYLQNLFLDEEDAISAQQVELNENPLSVIVPVLRRISNHTDFDALRLHPDVNLQFVHVESTPPPADLIILPGSKSVIADLAYLKKHGWNEHLNHHLRYGGKLLGICGGYQMLGSLIDDPDGIENGGIAQQARGFSHLRVDTVLESEKQLTRVQGTISLPDDIKAQVDGYEIHCGSSIVDESPFATLDHDIRDGAVSSDNQIIGTYLHGLFDQAESATALLRWAGKHSTHAAADVSTIREQQLDRLADAMEASLDLSHISPYISISTEETISDTHNIREVTR